MNYHANHFVYEIERAGANIEILEAFNKQAKYMSRHDELEYSVQDYQDKCQDNK